MRTVRRFSTPLLFVLLAALGAAACGSDGAGGAVAAEADPDATASADDVFPVTVDHKYGSTTVDERPERVVSVGFTDQDSLLSLGVVPVGIRDWYGDQPYAVWPWAQEALGDAEPEVLSASELNFEAIAALRPDLIVGVSSGMTDVEYETLSGIAPTITQTDEYVDYGVPWQEMHRTIGAVVGEAALAEEQIGELEGRFAQIAEDHPDWQGQEVAVSYALSESSVGAYASSDTRSRLLTALGFVIPEEFDDLAGDRFYSEFSFEELSRLDRDLIVWIGADDETIERIRTHPLHDGLEAAVDGREIFWTPEQGAAAGFSSPLSLPYLLDSFVPQIEAAVDGDPATTP